MGDIGSHWFDMAEHLTGLQVRSLCADLQTFHTTRKRPKQSTETFGGKLLTATDVEDTPVQTEDFGAVLFRMEKGVRGAMTASQVSAGRKNYLSIEISGTKSSVRWDQEHPDQLWIGQRDSPNQLIVKDPSLLKKGAAGYADLPGGRLRGIRRHIQANLSPVLYFHRRTRLSSRIPPDVRRPPTDEHHASRARKPP